MFDAGGGTSLIQVCVFAGNMDKSGSIQQMSVDNHRFAVMRSPFSLIVWSSFLTSIDPALSWSETHKPHVTLCFITAEAL